MTEYWVSQGNKWCDYCKIFISNNPASIRMHEAGKRHKDNVQLKLSSMKKDSAVKDLQQKKATEAMEKIENKARKQYKKDLEASITAIAASSSSTPASSTPPSNGWVLHNDSGYYFNSSTGYYYDPNSALYYSDKLGKWVSQQEATAQALELRKSQPNQVNAAKKPVASTTPTAPAKAKLVSKMKPKTTAKKSSEFASLQANESGSVAGKPTLGKRARDAKSEKGTISAEEKAALEAREAARKRTLEREAKHLGLYS